MEIVTENNIHVVDSYKVRTTKAIKADLERLSDLYPMHIIFQERSMASLRREWVSVHLARHHEGCEKFVHSQRQDINADTVRIADEIADALYDMGLLREGWKERDYLFQGETTDMDMTCNAQAFINISRKRLCKGCPSPETRMVWELVIEMLKEKDAVLASKCVPECVYRGFCPERRRCCGYVNTEAYKKALEEYRSFE